jgi:hypothetical protein
MQFVSFTIPSSSRQSNIQSHRLPQESLPSLHNILSQTDIISLDPSSSDKSHLHLSQVPSNTRSRTVAEGDESSLLLISQSLPPLRLELFSIRTPNFSRVVNRISGDAENSTGTEVSSVKSNALVVGRNLTG